MAQTVIRYIHALSIDSINLSTHTIDINKFKAFQPLASGLVNKSVNFQDFIPGAFCFRWPYVVYGEVRNDNFSLTILRLLSKKKY